MISLGDRQAGAGVLNCLITSASTGGQYCAFEVITGPGEGVPLHIHGREDEVYYILEGAYEIQCGEKVFRAEVGTMAVLPRNVPHSFRNPGTIASRALNLFIPGGFDEFVQELNELAPAEISQEQHKDRIRRKYGIQMLGP
ncbi:MAG: cupin domain-containing protein [Candidatus Sumerlaeaceae bacterium]